MFQWVLALHVVAVISWMAGMLYLFRLYVYHAEESEAIVWQRLQVWEHKLLKLITTPAMVVSVLTGGTMLTLEPALLHQPWMHIKLTAVLGMLACHGLASKYRRSLIDNPHVKSGKFFRLMNEVPTVLMIIIVVAVIVKPFGH
jgi:putative membrane protein